MDINYACIFFGTAIKNRILTINESNKLKYAVRYSLARLGEWEVLKESKYHIERDQILTSIRDAQNQLQALSVSWTNPKNIERLTKVNELIVRFNTTQNKIEKHIMSDKNLPATRLWKTKTEPRAEEVFQLTTKLIDSNRYLESSDKRKIMLTNLAEFRATIVVCLAQLRAFLFSAEPVYESKFNISLEKNMVALKAIEADLSILNEEQRKIFQLLKRARSDFAKDPGEIFAIRKSDKWNLARYELTNTASPVARDIIDTLNSIIKTQRTILEQEKKFLESDASEYINTLIWLTALAWFVAFFGYMYFRQKVSNPLNHAISDVAFLSEQVLANPHILSNSRNDITADAVSNYEVSRLLLVFKSIITSMKKQSVEIVAEKKRADLIAQESLKSQQSLIESQQELTAQKSAIDKHSLVSVTDLKGNIIYANDKFCAVSGYSVEELIGQNHRLLNSDNKPKSYWRNMYLTVSKGNFWHDEVCNKAKDGHLYWVDTTIAPNFGRNGKLEGYTSIRTDITAQKQMIFTLEEAKKQADQANISKTEFLANMSHEIRTPMNGIIGMTNLLLETDLDKEQKKIANTTKNSAESLLAIINDILDLSKIEAGQVELELLDFSLESIVTDVINNIRFLAGKKGIELEYSIAPIHDVWVVSDPGRIRQVLTNALSNAIKFTDEGTVTLEVDVKKSFGKKKLFGFKVNDTGIGVSPENLKKLFSKFTQADNSTTRKYGGTGLGLSICKEIIELMGGKIGMDSEEGKGTTLWFELALELSTKKDTIISTQNTFDKELADKKFNARILVVEDDTTNQAVIKGILSKFGLSIDVAGNGKEALELLETGMHYDLIFMDCQMPIMDGYETTRNIRESQHEYYNTEIPIIALTANAMREDKQKCIESGMDDYLTKPVEKRLILKALTKWLHTDMQNAVHDQNINQLIDDQQVVNMDEPSERNDNNIFDYQKLCEKLMNDKIIITTICQTFIDDIDEQILGIELAFDNADISTIASVAHKIKGAALNVCCFELGEQAKNIELTAKGDQMPSREELKLFKSKFGLAKDAVKQKVFGDQ